LFYYLVGNVILSKKAIKLIPGAISFTFSIYILYLCFINQILMATFTSSLPDDVIKLLTEKAKALSLPKNRLIENALRLYLEHLDRAEYIRSYKMADKDEDLVSIAEEGMQDYLRQLEQ